MKPVDALHARLAEAGISERVYSIDGEPRDETYTLSQDAVIWSVFYSERGIRQGERTFVTEEDACDALYERVVRDPTTRLKPTKG